MSHNVHVTDGINKDLVTLDREWYMEQTKGWKDPYGLPMVVQHDGFNIVRDDLMVGSKARFGDYFMSQVKEDTIVYVCPRKGLAGLAVLNLAKRYNKKVVLFMPASKEISDHQACCIERGAIPKFRRIAAMPNLNKMAKEYAEEVGGFFVPLGLYHPLVVAGVARVADNLTKVYGEPKEVWCAISTGVLSRGLQIGWPNATFYSIAVARNLKAGELGRSYVVSDPKPFLRNEKEDLLPPFPTVPNYDGKVWKYMKHKGSKDAWMWNVGMEPELKSEQWYQTVDSQREWGEIRD
jgi:hypothetical protein